VPPFPPSESLQLSVLLSEGNPVGTAEAASFLATGSTATIQLHHPNGDAVAWLTVLAESDGTHSLSDPVFSIQLQEPEQSVLLRRLLQHAVILSTTSKAAAIRVLCPDTAFSKRDLWHNLLDEFGFAAIAATGLFCQNQHTEIFQAGTSLAPVQIVHMSAVAVNQDRPLQTQVAELIRQIVSVSSDLTALPSPTASNLMQDWSDCGATMLLASVAKSPHLKTLTAVCVLANSTNLLVADSTPVPNLLYLGVHPEFRRQGLATQLLLHSATVLSDHPRRPLCAAVDLNNTAAIALYQSVGFRLQLRQQLLWRVLS